MARRPLTREVVSNRFSVTNTRGLSRRRTGASKRCDNPRVPAATWGLLAIYLAAVATIGFLWRRRAGRDEASYFVADRSLSPFWGFLGLASLTTGGSTTVALAAFVAEHGLAGIWLDLAGAIGLLLLGLLLAERVRREGTVTLPEIVGRYYGPAARRVAGALVLVSEIVWFALLIEATQVVLSASTGLSPTAAIVGSTAVFVLYTCLGGQFAVVRTDAVQYGLMVFGIPVLALSFALARPNAFAALPADELAFPVSSNLGAADVFALLVLIGLPHLVGSDVWAKLLSCRDEKAARRAALGASFSKVLFGGAVTAIALAAKTALPSGPAVSTLPRAILAFVPAPLDSLVLVCLVATMHSSADAVLLSAGAVTVRDVAPEAKRWWPPVAAARALTPLYAALGLLLALALDRNVLETLKLGYSIFAASLILPVLAALLAPRAVPRGAAIFAMVAGGALAAAGRFFPAAAAGLDPVLAGTAVNLVVLVAGAVFRKARTKAAS
jgi:SSS family solute:Na+ symporter